MLRIKKPRKRRRSFINEEVIGKILFLNIGKKCKETNKNNYLSLTEEEKEEVSKETKEMISKLIIEILKTK